MPHDAQQLIIRTLANGATAQLRSLVDSADKDEARRIRDELLRIAASLGRRHNFTVLSRKRAQPPKGEYICQNK